MSDLTSTAALARASDLVGRLQQTLRVAGPDPASLEGYSIARALRLAATRKNAANAASECKFEQFVDDELSKTHERRGRNSVLVPAHAILRELRTRATYSTFAAGTGGNLVETEVSVGNFVDALRPRSVVLRLGARTVEDLQGDVTIPRADTASTAYWVATAAGSGAVTESEATFDASPLTVAPSICGVFGTASRLLMQQVPAADQIISNDVAKSLGTALDVAAIQGAGTGGQPTGITNTSGVNAVSGTAFALATAITAEQNVLAANALENAANAAWVTTPAVAGLLAQRVKITGFPSYIWSGALNSGRLNGNVGLSTANCPAGTAIFGDWSQVMLLAWGSLDAIELEVNPFHNFASGDIAFRVLLPAGIAIRHAASFSVVTGVT